MAGYLRRVFRRARLRQKQATLLRGEEKLREAAAGLNLAVQPSDPDVPGSQARIIDRHKREMGISPQFLRFESRERLHAILAAFAAGAMEIKWIDGNTLVLDVAQHTIKVDVAPAGRRASGGVRKD